MIAHTYLGLNLVTVSNSDIVHLIAESENEHVLGISPRCTHALPYGNAFLSVGILPITCDDFAAHTHTCTYMSELTVAVSTLIQIHEIHIHGIPWYLGIVLGMEMEQRLGKHLQTMNPHLGRRESVHPCDDTYTTRIVICSLHDVLYLTRRIGGALIDNLYR